MSSTVAAVVLAAGAGTRLRPLTLLRPKPLCPVGPAPLVDHAIARARAVTGDVTVNVHHGRAMMLAHLEGRVRLSVEHPFVLGTAGAIGALRDHIAGRDVLVVNADAWCDAPLDALLDGWDRERPRLLVVEDRARGDFGDLRFAGASLLPWREVARLLPEPSGLYARVWGPASAAGRLDLVRTDRPFFDCGTVAEYHAANMAWSGGEPVVGARAYVAGTLIRSVVWPDAIVERDEVLRDIVRVGRALTLPAGEVSGARGGG